MKETNTDSLIITPLPIEGKKRRIWELDFLRGICVLLMVWDHLMYDVAFIFGKAWVASGSATTVGFVNFAMGYMAGTLRAIFHPIIFSMFFVICGISCSFSRSNLKRGIEALFFAFAITLITSLMDTAITFGVLHMLGFAILTWWLVDTICQHKRYVTCAVCLVVGIIITTLGHVESVWSSIAPSQDLFFLSPFLGGNYGSADYFPIFPYVGYMLIGAAVGPLIYPKGKSLLPMLDRHNWHAPFSMWGRVALWVYVLHQVIVMVVLCIVSYFLVGNFVFIS